MIIRSDRALRAVMSNHFKFGADAGIAVATLGSQVSGATTTNAGADIITWASSSGAYAGLSIEGSALEPQRDADTNYYGRPVSTADIVLRRGAHNPAASQLVRLLGQLG